jgi:mono/diheme cytochrome c family protein
MTAVAGLVLLSPTADAQDTDMSHGEYVARLGNCVACHSTPEGKPFAGGLKMAVPMLGNIYATNITPDKATGIGNYTFEDFDKATRHGVAKDGHHLYPAMPYPSYAKISEEDMHALYDYFMTEVEPVNQPNKESEIPAVLNWRWPLAVWNMLFLDTDRYEAKADQSAEWNRGAYIVQGLGHCGACHTPRGMLFQEAGLDESDSDYLAGASLDNWYASTLNGDVNSGLGRWSVDEVHEFLKTGKNIHGTAYGTMVEVVNNSTAFLTDDDLNAMAVYLKSLAPNRQEGATPWTYDSASREKLANLDFSEPGSATYYQFCVSCHQYDGSGQDKYMPALAGNPVVMDEDPVSLINLTLNGSLRVVAQGRPEHYNMPYFRVLLDDQQIADVVTYVRNAWGNAGSAVTTEQVAKLREMTDPTRNDDAIVLRMK